MRIVCRKGVMKLTDGCLVGTLLAVVACGGGGDGAPDAGPADAGTFDAAPFAFASVDPADGASPVSVWTKLTVSFTSPIDQEAFDPGFISVIADGEDVPGQVALTSDGSGIQFTPNNPLWYGALFQWSVDTVVGADGRSSPPMSFGFTTFYNPITRRTQYDSGGNVTGWIDYFTLLTYQIEATYVGAGADGTWFTSDDEVAGYSVREDDDQRRITLYANMDGAGADGVWFTADDVASTLRRYSYDPVSGNKARDILYDGPGSDGIWLTGDDDIQTHTGYTYNEAGDLETTLVHNAPGTDGVWLTADDVAYRGGRTEYVEAVRVRTLIYDAPGADGLWLTGDDQLDMVETYQHDEQGRLTRHATFDGPGVDGVWLNADDDVVYYRDWGYDTGGNINRQGFFNAAGADGVWFTADDVASSYFAYELDADGRSIRSDWIVGPGPDGLYGTADDELGSYTTWSYLPEGSWSRRLTYNGPGSDGVWLTADDTVQTAVLREYDSLGNRTTFNQYNDPGPDGQWLTADDLVQWREDYDPTQ